MNYPLTGDRFGLFGRFRHHFVGLSDADDFLNRGFALRDATPAVMPKINHSFGDRALLQLTSVALLHDHFSQRLGDDANFVDGRAPLIASLPAIFTAFAPL